MVDNGGVARQHENRVEAFHEKLEGRLDSIRDLVMVNGTNTVRAMDRLTDCFERLVDSNERQVELMKTVVSTLATATNGRKEAAKESADAARKDALIRWVVVAVVGALITMLAVQNQAVVHHLEQTTKALTRIQSGP